EELTSAARRTPRAGCRLGSHGPWSFLGVRAEQGPQSRDSADAMRPWPLDSVHLKGYMIGLQDPGRRIPPGGLLREAVRPRLWSVPAGRDPPEAKAALRLGRRQAIPLPSRSSVLGDATSRTPSARTMPSWA